MSLAGKKIVLGVSGGIAAYKIPELVRRLRDRGAKRQKPLSPHLACRRFLGIPFPTVCLTRQPKPLWAILSWVNGLI